MTVTTKVDFDSICEHYESIRSSGYHGPDAINAFLQQFYPSMSSERKLIGELAQIDLQLSWMNWDKRLKSKVETEAIDVVLSDFNRLPTLDSYLKLVPTDTPEVREILRDIAKCEMESRATWGDSIGPAHFVSKYELELTPMKRSRNHFVIVHPEVPRPNVASARFEIRGRSVIGRQRTSDTSDLFCEQRSDGNRIVVADLQQAFVSREQISLLLLNPRFALLTNIGSKSPVLIAGYGKVNPGDSMILSFDFIVRLPNCRLHFVRPAAIETQ